jgi:hypothetical protein
MLVLIHVIIATASLVFSGSTALFPSEIKLRASYFLTGATVATGTLLVISETAHMLQTCLIGLTYLAAILLTTITTRQRLAKAKIQE